MKSKYEMSFAAFLVIVIAIIGLIVTITSYFAGIDGETKETASNVIPDTITETVFEPIPAQLPEDTIFEPIETATPDTSEAAPKTDERNAETEQNVSENDFDAAFSEDDLIYLAKIVQNEAGSNWCTDEHQKAVASVVLNRVSDPRFPDTVYGVISQGWNGECPLQYNVGSVERFNGLEPSERALANAQYVLEHGSTVGAAIWQAEFIQGEIVAQFAYPEVYSTITYICE